jgi:hypothetical protein
MELDKITEREFEENQSKSEILLETEVSILKIMSSSNVDDIIGLSEMHNEELLGSIQKKAPATADVYILGEKTESEPRRFGAFGFCYDVIYPIKYVRRPKCH